MATHSSILVWKISWTERPGRLQSMESQRVGLNWASRAEVLVLSDEVLASRKPLHARQTGMVDHPLSPPESSMSTNGTRLSRDSKSQNWPPVQTHPNTQEFLSLMSEDALSSTCSFSLPRDSSSPLDRTTLNCQEPLPFPVGPISHSALGPPANLWKQNHCVESLSLCDSV